MQVATSLQAQSVDDLSWLEEFAKAGRSWACNVKGAWDPCYLCFDGGGVRSYSSLLTLKLLMHEIWMWENRFADEELDLAPQTSSSTDHFANHSASGSFLDRKRLVPSESELLPCHYFDFFIGSSSGGILATLLGRLRMTVEEAVKAFLAISRAMFDRPTWKTIYDHTVMDRCIRDIVASRCTTHTNCDGEDSFKGEILPHEGSSGGLFDVNNPRQAHVACLSAVCVRNWLEVFPLRTYPLRYAEDTPNRIKRYPEGSSSLSIAQILRATTATPAYFRSIKVPRDDGQMILIDGTLENNPSEFAHSEFQALYTSIDNPAVLLSIGTGRPQHALATHWAQRLTTPLYRNQNRLISLLAQCHPLIQDLVWMLIKLVQSREPEHLHEYFLEGEKQHHSIREHARGEHTWYKRLNCTSNHRGSTFEHNGLTQVAMDEWRDGHYGDVYMSGGSTLQKIHDITMQDMNREYDAKIDSYASPSVMLRQAAEKLVRQRRAREAEGGHRYHVFVGKATRSA